jgi:hypothetical protein
MKTLTNKLRGPEYVFEFISEVNFVSQAKVNNLDPRFGDISVQKHYILRLERERERERERDLKQTHK